MVAKALRSRVLAHPFGVLQWKLRAADEAKGAIDVDRPRVTAPDVEERCFARTQHPVDDAAHKSPCVPASPGVRMRADGANLAKVADPHPLTSHRHEPPSFANAEEPAKFDRA